MRIIDYVVNQISNLIIINSAEPLVVEESDLPANLNTMIKLSSSC